MTGKDFIQFIPRGFMCMTCEHKYRKCNHLDFTKMQVIGVFKDDGTKEVKCTDFNKEGLCNHMNNV